MEESTASARSEYSRGGCNENDDVHLVQLQWIFLKSDSEDSDFPLLTFFLRKGFLTPQHGEKDFVIRHYSRVREVFSHHHGSASQQLHAQRPSQQPHLGLHEEPSLRGPRSQSAVALPAGPFLSAPEARVPGLHRLLQLLPGADCASRSLPP